MIEHVSKVRLGWLENRTSILSQTYVGVIKFVSVPPPFFTSIMEDGLLIKNHSSTAGMAGNDDFLEGPDCVESSC